jgi:hypothetical protein
MFSVGYVHGNMLYVVSAAVALKELLDYVFCAGLFDAPAEPAEEQQAALQGSDSS